MLFDLNTCVHDIKSTLSLQILYFTTDASIQVCIMFYAHFVWFKKYIHDIKFHQNHYKFYFSMIFIAFYCNLIEISSQKLFKWFKLYNVMQRDQKHPNFVKIEIKNRIFFIEMITSNVNLYKHLKRFRCFNLLVKIKKN